MNSKAKGKLLTIALMFILASCTSVPAQIATAEFAKTIKPTFTTTITPTDTPSPTTTPEPTIYEYDKSTSPDGKWTTNTSVLLNEDNGHVIFTVTNNSDNSVRIIEELEIPGPIKFPVIFDYPYVLEWTDDGSSFYFSYLFSFPDGCFSISKPGGTGLKRYDLSSNNAITIHESPTTWMAFSPNESRLAYIKAYGGIVFVMDMNGNNIQPFAPLAVDKSGLTYYANFILLVTRRKFPPILICCRSLRSRNTCAGSLSYSTVSRFEQIKDTRCSR
jgi:WD40 repeat protein